MQKKKSYLRKESLKEDKTNPIVSKLLGANPREINIEKFREIKKKLSLPPNLKLSKQLLKSITNKFSLQIIFSLTLTNQNLTSITLLEECKNLIYLDISNNNITDIKPLQTLTEIKFLNVSNNSIYSVEELKEMNKLIHLSMQGNVLKSVIMVKPLKKLEKLRTLYFQNLDCSNSNPLCKEQNYRDGIFEIAVNLIRLDGLPKSIKEIPNGSELDQINKKNNSVNIKTNQSIKWFGRDLPKAEEFFKNCEFKKEKNLIDDIKSCNELIKSLESEFQSVGINSFN